uniref:RxLR effector candidate protein n=1 Tax=Peronospora matthiolae TaxID=2874970 RepID=A0AAV1TAF7_9STRA
MRVFLLALVAAPTFLIRADILSKAGRPQTKGPHGPAVVPVLTKDHDEDIHPDMLPGVGNLTNIEERMNLMDLDDVAHWTELADILALAKDESPGHVIITKAFNAFEAAHPGVTLEDAISKRSEMMQLAKRFAHMKQLVFESLVSERGEAEMAKSLAGLQESQNEVVKDFGIKYLQVLTNWWADDGEQAPDVFYKLKMNKRTVFDLLKGESTSDVVLKTFCTRIVGGKLGLALNYHTIVEAYGGTMKFMKQVNESVFVPELREEALKFLVRLFKIMDGNEKLTNPVFIKYLDQYLYVSDYVKDLPGHFQETKMYYKRLMDDLIVQLFQHPAATV